TWPAAIMTVAAVYCINTLTLAPDRKAAVVAWSTMATAMPSAPLAMAAFMSLTTLTGHRGARSGPLVAAAEQCAGVFGAVTGGHKKRVGGDVVDEYKTVGGVLRIDAAACGGLRQAGGAQARNTAKPASAPPAPPRRMARWGMPFCSSVLICLSCS